MCVGRELIPQFLRVYFVNGVGETALKGADLSKKGSPEREFVSRIAGGAKGAEWRDKDTESGKMIKGKLSLFGWDRGKGSALIDATKL